MSVDNAEVVSTDSGNDPDWILDSLVAYLRSPVWNIPIQNFMEQKSVIFDPDTANDDEYRKVHEEFRNLVDLMLGAYMDDLSLQPDVLEKALLSIHPSVRSAALEELLEPVKAAGDFECFAHLMQVKNRQLHRQALEILQQQREMNGVFEGIPSLEDDHIPTVIDESFEEEIREALRLSLLEQEKDKNCAVLEQRDLERALAVSVAHTFTAADKVQEKQQKTTLQTLEENEEPTLLERAGTDVESRRALLRAQRDRLLAFKQQERQKQLKQLEDLQQTSGGTAADFQLRPKSGTMARAVLAGKASETAVDEKTLQYRRLLLQKIRNEVEGETKKN